MATICVCNYCIGVQILRYNTETGRYVIREERPIPSYSGFFEYCNDGVVGVYASEDGPILFHNERQYKMTEQTFEMRVVSDDEGNWDGVFHCSSEGKELFVVKYNRGPDLSLFLFSYEECDFFKWLKERNESPNFRSWYTRSHFH
jgi:hypothetical protein